MIYQNTHLRQMFEIEVFKSAEERDAKKPKTKTETVLAWNAVDAIRRSGDLAASEPKSLGYVTPGDDPYFIEDPQKGPTKKKANPTIKV